MNQAFTRTQLIQRFIDALKAERYLEFGVFKGKVLFDVNCKQKVGIDPTFKQLEHKTPSELEKLGILLAKMTSDKFFASKMLYLLEKHHK